MRNASHGNRMADAHEERMQREGMARCKLQRRQRSTGDTDVQVLHLKKQKLQLLHRR